MNRKVLIVFISFLIVSSISFANTPYSVRLRNGGLATSTGYFMYHLGPKMELGLGFGMNYMGISAFGETLHFTTYLPILSSRYYILEKKDGLLKLYLGMDYGTTSGTLDSSANWLDDTIEDANFDNINGRYVSYYIGTEYFLGEQDQFSLSGDFGWNELIWDENIKVEASDVEIFSLTTDNSGFFFTFGVNYHFVEKFAGLEEKVMEEVVKDLPSIETQKTTVSVTVNAIEEIVTIDETKEEATPSIKSDVMPTKNL